MRRRDYAGRTERAPVCRAERPLRGRGAQCDAEYKFEYIYGGQLPLTGGSHEKQVETRVLSLPLVFVPGLRVCSVLWPYCGGTSTANLTMTRSDGK